MSQPPFIPKKTQEEMASAHPPGTRHAAMFTIAMPLIGNGMHPDAVFAQLRSTFPDTDKTDKEIRDVVEWCLGKNPTPSGFGDQAPRPQGKLSVQRPKPLEPLIPPTEKMAWWLNGHTATAEQILKASPVEVPQQRELQAFALFSALYGPDECINIVRQHTVNEKGKANPQGAGKAMSGEAWTRWTSSNGFPEGDAGAWIRPNPTKETGSGKGGAVTDADITAFRFLLVESDSLTLEQQFAFAVKSQLPIAAIIRSGGDSIHSWVRLDAKNDEEYTKLAAALISTLEPFGYDRANKNPSRLSRLPGALRKIGASGDGIQSLLSLNPACPALTMEGIEALKERLKLPLVNDKPFLPIFQRALQRYAELEANKGKLGVPTGITDFDSLTGGLKNGQMIVIAAKTGGGKTTLATNIINSAAWHNGIGVALFTLEMDRDEICDLLVSLNCSVDRNVFNHGNFSDYDTGRIVAHAKEFQDLPLWIADEPVMTVEQIRSKVMQLKQEGRIGLVVVDYLQFVSGGESFKDNREQQIAGISRALRSLAKDAKLPVIALSQLNDEGKLRESRVIAHDAHIVMMVEETEEGDCLMVKIEKGRSIPKGTYMMRFEKQFGRLTPVKMTHKQEPSEHPNARRR